MHLLSALHALFLQSILLQPDVTAAAGEAAESGGGSGGMGCGMQIGMMAAIFALTYFLLLRPERQRQQEADKLQSGLKVGQKVRTTSGILGEILRLNDDNRSVMLGVADKVKLNILRANIAGPDVEPEKPPAAGDKSSDKGSASSAGEEKKA